jgi:hypothetical protein
MPGQYESGAHQAIGGRVSGHPAAALRGPLRLSAMANAAQAGDSERQKWLGSRRTIARILSRLLRRRSYDWGDLQAELDRCRSPMMFWWRDDDAIAETPALATLLCLRAELDLPLALAVVPAHVEPSLVARLDREAAIGILQHGWDHTNHAEARAPRSEFPPGRSPAEIQAQLTQGRQRLHDLFPGRFLPVLVPPFNALAADAVEAVRASDLSRISLASDFAGLALPSRNVHADLIDWRRGGAVSTASAVRSLILALRLRRFGLTEAGRPIGVLTHHLVHDEGIWSLTRELLSRLKAHPKVTFAPIDRIFA